MSSLNPADLRFVFPSKMNFWDERMLGINSEKLHIP
jgi:hypothetical protein